MEQDTYVDIDIAVAEQITWLTMANMVSSDSCHGVTSVAVHDGTESETIMAGRGGDEVFSPLECRSDLK